MVECPICGVEVSTLCRSFERNEVLVCQCCHELRDWMAQRIRRKWEAAVNACSEKEQKRYENMFALFFHNVETDG